MAGIMNVKDLHSSWRGFISKYVWIFLLPTSVLIYGSHSILLNLCKDERGKIVFNSAALVLMIELTKLLISLALWLSDLSSGRDGGKSARILPLTSCWMFAIPALLYAINNNLVVFIQEFMDPASFQILCNLKIVSTAFLYRIFLKNRLSFKQWLAIGLLLAGSVSNGLAGITSSGRSRSLSEIYVTIPGLLLILIYCSISGMSGIYTEYILKKYKQVSLHQQNVFLYLFGLVFNSVGYIMTSRGSSDDSLRGFFTGFSTWTVVIILTQSLNGMIMGYLFKHGNNIMRLFTISASMLVTTVFSVIIFSLQLNVFFYMALLSVMFALWLYYNK
ncbi:probable UDP-sugar transporter protein SLC35A4 [Diadema setosum]|uniref:probable UDP-sugar transporter protein SLC35A4 n=1 Tax=Diadema setosum TaxID=31175 RepID=UPI003B3B34E3